MLVCVFLCCFFRQKTSYEMRISDWSSDVCSSDLDYGDEELDRENEEGRDDDDPGDHEHRNLDKIVEEIDRADQFGSLHEKRPGRIEPGSREPPRHQQVLRSDCAAARGQAKPGRDRKSTRLNSSH